MTNFFRFPHTPHLAWLGPGQPRDDKVLTGAEAAELLSDAVVVEEKVDGANVGFSVSDGGELRVQNRGSYLERESAHPQFRPLWAWMAAREAPMVDALWPHYMLFGEWCHAVHSVVYTGLPDWFLGFDVYDRSARAFWDSPRRDALLALLGLHAVPRVASGRLTIQQLRESLTLGSRLGGEVMEGVVIRREVGGFTAGRAKLVRAEFTQTIEEHWSRGPLRRNQLAPTELVACR